MRSLGYKFGISLVDLWKKLGLRLKMIRFQFGPSNYDNYCLVLELWKNDSFFPILKFEILDIIKGAL